MAQGPKNAMAKRSRGPRRKPLAVRDWYTAPRAEEVARRSEVWGLLRFYHETFIEPHRGLRGFVRRMWWRLTGQRQRLLSPWQQLEVRAAALAERRAAELEEEQRRREELQSNSQAAPT